MTYVENLKRLLYRVDGIEGHTVGGRLFKIRYRNDQFYTQIFQDGNVYEPTLRIADVIGNNILSVINKIEQSFFTHRTPTVTKRSNIYIDGTKDGVNFTIDVRIEDGWVIAKMNYKNDAVSMSMRTEPPAHIPYSQRHNWQYLHLQKPESWESTLSYNFKNNFYKCCGKRISGDYNYCHYCGKKQEVNGIKLNNITGKELLSKLS